MKYKLVAFDHDDTLVNSTPLVHYPAFMKALEVLRPRAELTMDEFLSYSFDPGFAEMCSDILGFTPEEMDYQYNFWLEYVRRVAPKAFPGIKELLLDLKKSGMLIAVVSHSFEENIRRDFNVNGLVEPDAVYGWTKEKEFRKPSRWPLDQLIERFSVAPGEILVVDDLKPGKVMADCVGADFAAAGWGYDVPAVRNAMRAVTPNYYPSITEFETFILG